jgi:hypothetical protein
MNNNINEDVSSKTIEEQTAKIPSTAYLIAAIAAMGVSATFKCLKKPHTALFFGQWAAPFLLFGIYNKIVKVAGHDQEDR